MKCLKIITIILTTIFTTIFVSILQVSSQQYNNNQNVPRVITIGAVFDDNDPLLELAFREAIDQVSLQRSSSRQTRIEAYVVNVKPGDSFHAGKIVCNMIARGVWAIFGPSTPSVSWLVRSIANNLHIPHIQFNWDYQRSSSLLSNSRASTWAPRDLNMTLNLYPEASSLSTSFMELIAFRGWKSFTIVYDDNNGLIKLKDVLKIPVLRSSSKLGAGTTDDITKMSIRQFQSNSTYKKLFKDMSKKFETNVILNVKLDQINDILRQARSVGMMSEYHNYVITDLDMHTLDLTEFKDTNCNISGLSLIDIFGTDPLRMMNLSPTRSSQGQQQQGQGQWSSDGRYRSQRQQQQFNFNPIPTVTTRRQQTNYYKTTAPSLLYDAVALFVRAVDDLERTQVVYGPSLTCEQRSVPWAFGSILINFMKMMSVNGLTGNVKFDTFGQRSDFSLDIIEFKKTGFRKTGTWDPKNKVVITRNLTSDADDVKEALRNKTLRCSIPTNAEPYAMWKEDYLNRTGNDRIEGYCVDLLDELSSVLGFKIDLVPAPKNAYGSFKNGEWNGMIRELLDRKVDIAIADLTITSARQAAVDFTLPFMNLGISILYKKPEETPPDLFSFLKPFSVEVWIYMATAFLGVSLLLYIISRISPYEWVSGHPCDDDPEELENQFSLGNCLWFSLGSIMQQGSDLAPRALSTRTLASIWWFFTLIMISSYTANLAAFLTVSRMASPIENAEDLAKQTTIQYGCKYDGATYNFFKTSNHTTYERMWSTMEAIRPSVFVKSNAEGIDRVKKGNYAYLMESTSIEYEVQRNCDLQQIGSNLDQKGYGIATPPDSPYRGLISEAILQLQESGKLQELKTRWWVERIINQGITCPPDKKDSSMELDIGNVGGVFVVLIAGTAVGVLIVIIEFVWKTKKVARHERDHAALMMWRELIRICSGGGGHRTTGSSSGSSTNGGNNSSTSSSNHSDAGHPETETLSKKSKETTEDLIKKRKKSEADSKRASIAAEDKKKINKIKMNENLQSAKDNKIKRKSEEKEVPKYINDPLDDDVFDIPIDPSILRRGSSVGGSSNRKVSLRSIGVAPSFDGDYNSDRPYFMPTSYMPINTLPTNMSTFDVLPPPILFDTTNNGRRSQQLPMYNGNHNNGQGTTSRRSSSIGEHRF